MEPVEFFERTEDERHRLLLNSITDYAIYMLDAAGRISSWNPGAERFKGYRADEILGEHFSRFYTEEDRAAGLPERALAEAATNGRFEGEGWRVNKDGGRFWASVVIDPIYDGGALAGFAKITRDITDKHEAQRALEEAQEDLLQSRKLEALGQLAGGIAHDFNNLLMAISGSLELVRKRMPDDPRITSLLDNALQGASRGSALTQRLLAFSRRQPLNHQLVDLPELVRGLRDLLQLSVGDNVSIDLQAPLSPCTASVDPNQLELALLNVVANARDAMPEGGRLTISVSEQALPSVHETRLSGGEYVCLAVSDTGEGMDERTLERAADPFFTTKGPGKGTGLGLSAVHGLLEDSGGRLTLKSQKGEGTTVEMWLPMAERIPEEKPVKATEQEVPEDQPVALRVLAVDDDVLVLMNTVAMLEDLGHTVFQAFSGAAALRQMDAQEVDLVITDHGMPGMTGLQLAQEIRRRAPGLPIIVATGYIDLDLPEDDPLRALPTLNKPFGLEELRRAVDRMRAPNSRGAGTSGGDAALLQNPDHGGFTVESMRFDGPHELAIARPLSHSELVQLQRRAPEALACC